MPLEHLAEYTARLTEVFEKHGTRGTWYAHAAVGCLHVRPVLNLRLDKDVEARCAPSPRRPSPWCANTRARIPASTATGWCASEFHEPMFGSRLVRAFEEVKDRFDPNGLFNPGKIVRAPKFDDRSLFPLSAPGYHGDAYRRPRSTGPPIRGAVGGFQGAVEMCNNNGACRALAGGVMCPSYRVTRDEQRCDARPRQHAAARR